MSGVGTAKLITIFNITKCQLQKNGHFSRKCPLIPYKWGFYALYMQSVFKIIRNISLLCPQGLRVRCWPASLHRCGRDRESTIRRQALP